jgi:hypothetical protein
MRPNIRSAARIPVVAATLLAGFALTGCATTEYVDEQIAAVNGRIDATDAKATDGIQRADAANQRAEAANSAAGAAAGEARAAAQRLDQLTPRVDALEQQNLRTPRN